MGKCNEEVSILDSIQFFKLRSKRCKQEVSSLAHKLPIEVMISLALLQHFLQVSLSLLSSDTYTDVDLRWRCIPRAMVRLL